MSADKTEHSGGYEASDVNVRTIVLIAVAVIFIVVISLVVLNEYFLSVKEQYVDQMVLQPESLTLRDLRATEDEVLNSYKLLDSAGSVYRIPIERAMELEAEEAYQSSANR